MAGLQYLDDIHKAAAAEILRGTPKTEIMRKLNLGRTLLYDWLQDPLFSGYLKELQASAQVEREQMMLPISRKMAQALEAMIDRILAMLKDPEVQFVDPGKVLEDLIRCYAALADIQRKDQGWSLDDKRYKIEGTRGGRIVAIEGPEGSDEAGGLLKRLGSGPKKES